MIVKTYLCIDFFIKNIKFKIMKKVLLSLCLVILGGAFFPSGVVIAAQPIPLQVGYEDPTGSAGEMPRSPIQPPFVSIEDNVLYMGEVPYDVTLQLIDEDMDIVYTVFVPAYTPSVILPSNLSGEYELRLIWGYWIFYGFIDL